MHNSSIINAINNSYQYHKSILLENEVGINEYPMSQVVIAKRICNHIEFVVKNMDERFKVIVENDILLNKFDSSIKEGVSTSTYYRNRAQAYEIFIKELSR